jgi:hypothetical protein
MRSVTLPKAACLISILLLVSGAAHADCFTTSVDKLEAFPTEKSLLQSTNPGVFADVVEVVVRRPIRDATRSRGTRFLLGRNLDSQVDTNSTVEINLFVAGMTDALKDALQRDPSKITVTVKLVKGSKTTDFPVAPGWFLCGTLFEGPVIEMGSPPVSDQDEVQVTLKNADVPAQSVTYNLTRTALGWHQETRDSVAFVQRVGVSKNDVQQGFNKVNFAPAPGVSFGTLYTPRPGGKAWILDFLKPGFGITASFLDWKDTVTVTDNNPSDTFNVNNLTLTGAQSTNVNLGLGAEASLFNGSIEVLYGWNLQTAGPRRYWGIGISFVSVYQTISSLTSSGKKQ